MQSRIANYLTDTRAKDLYVDLISTIQESYLEPHVFVQKMMELYHTNAPQGTDRSIHGRYFEYVIGETLAMNGVRHMYYQAVVEHVSLAVFDWFLYHRTHPVSISCKTKARDRWKQAAHEGFALKQVYAQASNYLITIERLPKSEEKKEQAPRTIDHFVVATEEAYTQAIRDITQREYTEAVSIPPISNGTLISINSL